MIEQPRRSVFGLSQEDLNREVLRFGVADEQVRRDHAISHVLASLSADMRSDLIFIGGTALSRTHLVHKRLSEDIDLIAIGDRRETATRLMAAINRRLIKSHGRPTWSPEFSDRDTVAAVLQVPDNIAIKVQLLDGGGYEPWPTELRDIEQRYRDVPPATLQVPTIESFAGWKTAAWHDRNAPRDLYDLWALAETGSLSAEAAAVFAQHGPIGTPPRSFMFTQAPSEAAWESALAAQTRLHVSAADALALVRRSWAEAVGEDWE